MNRAEALEALDAAVAERIGKLFSNLIDGYEGTANDRKKAETAFEAAIGVHLSAHAFAANVLTEKFKE